MTTLACTPHPAHPVTLDSGASSWYATARCQHEPVRVAPRTPHSLRSLDTRSGVWYTLIS